VLAQASAVGLTPPTQASNLLRVRHAQRA